MKHLCFVAHWAAGVLSGGHTGHIGGVERQTTLMSRWFAERGYRVSVVTWDEPDTVRRTAEGVEIIPMCGPESGLTGLRFLHPRWTSLIRALRRANADLYYQNCAECVTGQVALWCRRNRRPFVYSVASEPDCDARLPAVPTYRERLLYRYGLRHADRVIVQNRKQQTMLWNNFGRLSVVIPLPCEQPREVADGARRRLDRWHRVLWVGRIAPVKRLHLLLDVALALPDVAFDVVGLGDVTGSSGGSLLDRARHLPNVTLHGRVVPDRMEALYQRATLLCCTSAHEGFPNTFLEAWSHGVPIVSTVDPDGIITQQRLGRIASDVHTLTAHLRDLLASEEVCSEMARNARRYYLAHHTPETVMPLFEQLFLTAMGAVRGSGGTGSA